METLTDRAERALLGALLQMIWAAPAMGLRPDEFASRHHASLFRVILEMAGTGRPETRGLTLAEVSEMSVAARVPARYLRELPSACPDPLHAPAYAALIAEASGIRRLLTRAQSVVIEAEAVGTDAWRLAKSVRGTEAYRGVVEADDVRRVAEAIRSNASRFNPDALTGIDVAPPGILDSRERMELQVLAALVNGHPESGQVFRMLPPAAFADSLRRQVYETARGVHITDCSIDSLTVDWALTRRNPSVAVPGSDGGRGPGYMAQLEAMPTAKGPILPMAYAMLVASGNNPSRAVKGVVLQMPGLGAPVRPDPILGPQPGLLQPPQPPADGPAPEPRR